MLAKLNDAPFAVARLKATGKLSRPRLAAPVPMPMLAPAATNSAPPVKPAL